MCAESIHISSRNVVGVRAFMELAAKEPNVTTTVLSTVNGKGWDGFTVSVVH